MLKALILFLLSSIFYISTALHSAIPYDVNNDFSSMSCNELMLGLINDSSFSKTFSDKSMALEFGFERYNINTIGLVFVKTKGVDKGGIYVNLRLNLAKYTLRNIDPFPSILMGINKSYVPYIAEKCTPDKNIYLRTGKSPSEEEVDDVISEQSSLEKN